MLAVSRSNAALATVDIPPALSERVLNALRADPRAVDVRAQASHFYALGARMLELFEEDEIAQVLTEVRRPRRSMTPPAAWRAHADPSPQTFQLRAAAIADYAHNARGNVGEGTDFLQGLDEAERKCEERHLQLDGPVLLTLRGG